MAEGLSNEGRTTVCIITKNPRLLNKCFLRSKYW
jgi:hypothetical protein